MGVPGPRAAPAARPAHERRSGSAERDAWAVLASIHGLGPVGLAALLGRYRTGIAILAEASAPGGVGRLADTGPDAAADGAARPRPVSAGLATAIAEAAGTAQRILDRLIALGLEVVTVEEPEYSHRLGAIELPPHVLFVLGDLKALDPGSAVAVVGATVVSGLALGIDGEAHRATLDQGGSTVAVIGSGHARLFPRDHTDLAQRIAANGGAVVSELAPDVAATPGTFPRRNRVISGLSDATVVVEAPPRSGALITASWALEQGRECFLVPGPIGEHASAGCLSFLREYAGSARIVAGVPQLLDDLGLIDHDAPDAVEATPAAEATLVELGRTAGRIGRALVAGRATVDELVAVTGLPVATVLAALTLLEGRGLVQGSYGRYRPSGPLVALDPGLPGRGGRC